MEASIDASRECRACLTTENVLLSLFAVYKDQYFLPQLIADCIGIEVSCWGNSFPFKQSVQLFLLLDEGPWRFASVVMYALRRSAHCVQHIPRYIPWEWSKASRTMGRTVFDQIRRSRHRRPSWSGTIGWRRGMWSGWESWTSNSTINKIFVRCRNCGWWKKTKYLMWTTMVPMRLTAKSTTQTFSKTMPESCIRSKTAP